MDKNLGLVEIQGFFMGCKSLFSNFSKEYTPYMQKQLLNTSIGGKMMISMAKLFNYHAWATDKLLCYIETEVPDSFSAEITSVFPSIAETFQHQYEVDCLWYGRMNKNYSIKGEHLSSPQDYRKAFQELHQEIESFIADSSNLNRKVRYSTSTGEEFTNDEEELLQHLVNHGTYHRGNISAMLRQQGHPGCSTDYIYYLREMEG